MKGQEIINYAVSAEMPNMDAIRNKCNANCPSAERAKKIFPKRNIAAAIAVFVISLASITTAFAYGDVIITVTKQFMFGNSSAKQVEQSNENDMQSFIRINNESKPASVHNMKSEAVPFSSIEEANEVAQFHIQIPTFVPEDASMGSIWLQQFEDKTYGYNATFSYTVQLDDISEVGLFVVQNYMGADATVEFETIVNIQKIMIGSIEAVSSYDGERIGLHWVENGVLFEMFSTHYDLETAIKIAESMY